MDSLTMAVASVNPKRVKQAYEVLTNQNISGVLIGTAALKLLGFNVFADDIDFLVEKAPQGEGLELKLMQGSTENSATTHIDGLKVDYIPAAGLRKRYFHPLARSPVYGVRVATLDDILGLKRLADRPKDREFLHRWSYGLIDLEVS